MNTRQHKQDRMYQRIHEHGMNLKAAFCIDGDPLDICRKLHRIELKVHKLAEDYCNGLIDSEKWEIESEKARGRVSDIIGAKYLPVIRINGDPRGYALKIDDTYIRENAIKIYRDWGGYGILAPEFDGEE